MNLLPAFEAANVNAVTERIWIGGDLAVHHDDLAFEQAEELVAKGLTHVVDVRSELDDTHRWARYLFIDYRTFDMPDESQQVPSEWFDRAVGHLQDALQHSDTIVLTHCHSGVNRGPSLGFALLLAEGWEPVDALAAIRTARPSAYVYYAEQALAWYHRRFGTSARERLDEADALAAWRLAHPLGESHLMA